MTKTRKISKKSVRLEPHIYPTHYHLHLHPDLLSFTFSGNEIIKINTDKDIKNITLHSKDLDIETVSIKSNKKEQFAYKITYDTKKETATFYFKNVIPKGKGELSIVFSGIISDSLRGFYKSRYVVDGVEKHIATTQFETTDARRAFPCFDEHAHKAVFEVSLVIPESHTAISNTLPINIAPHSTGYKIVSFAPSPIMSTYLLAFIIGEFEFIESKTKEGVQVRVFTTKGKIHQARFALEVAIKSLEFFNKYFDIPYPLPILDLIAIPDFESAAMENWGAITFRETALLVSDENTSLVNRQWVATAISHEIAHQWFGNLVTMHWWTDLWLNEGFAAYMEKFCVDHLFPQWNTWPIFFSGGRYKNAVEIDSLENSHPIEVDVNHPDEINETFDMVSYEKGCTLIRMLSMYLGEDKFRDGLRYYLKKHSYKNTQTINLWEAFEKVSKKPVKKMMSSWTKQAGFPLVSISSHKSDLWLTQERFFSSRVTRRKFERVEKSSKWQIPLSCELINKDKVTEEKLLINKTKTKIKGNAFGLINLNESSFLKVNYDHKTLEYLKTKIKEKKIAPIDRLGIIKNLFSLAEGGYIKASEVLEFSQNYKDETEYMIWLEIASGVRKIYNVLIEKGEETLKYKKYALSLFSPLADKFGFEKMENESHGNTLLRSLAISQAGFYGDKYIIKEAKKVFDNRNIKPIDPDLKTAIYGVVISNGGLKEWKTFEYLYTNTDSAEERDTIGRSLGSFNNYKVVEKALRFSMSKHVRSQDTPFILASIWRNKEGQDLAWNFVKDNWEVILKRYGGSNFLTKFLPFLGYHTKKEDLIDAKKFFSKNVAPGGEKTLKQSYEQLESNIAWIKDDKKDIQNWLDKNY